MAVHLYFDTTIPKLVRNLLEAWSNDIKALRQMSGGEIETDIFQNGSARTLQAAIEADDEKKVLTEVVANILEFPDVVVPFLQEQFKVKPCNFGLTAHTFIDLLEAAQTNECSNEKTDLMLVLFIREKEEADKASAQFIRYFANDISPTEMLRYAMQHPHAIFYGIQQVEPTADSTRLVEPIHQFMAKFKELFKDQYGADFVIELAPGTLEQTVRLIVHGDNTQGLYTSDALARVRAVINLLYP